MVPLVLFEDWGSVLSVRWLAGRQARGHWVGHREGRLLEAMLLGRDETALRHAWTLLRARCGGASLPGSEEAHSARQVLLAFRLALPDTPVACSWLANRCRGLLIEAASLVLGRTTLMLGARLMEEGVRTEEYGRYGRRGNCTESTSPGVAAP